MSKLSLQEKIADLERRILELEKRQCTDARATQTMTRVNLEPEMGRIWASVDALFKKAFGR